MSPPGSQNLPCGSLLRIVPPSSYFFDLSRCASAVSRMASGNLPMVARTVVSDSFERRRCRFGQSLAFEHDTRLPFPVTTLSYFRMWYEQMLSGVAFAATTFPVRMVGTSFKVGLMYVRKCRSCRTTLSPARLATVAASIDVSSVAHPVGSDSAMLGNATERLSLRTVLPHLPKQMSMLCRSRSSGTSLQPRRGRTTPLVPP